MRSSSARTGEEDNENSVPVEGRAGRPDLLKEVMAVPEGFEPSTSRLEGGCSIQLSYGTTLALLDQGLGHEKAVGVVGVAFERATHGVARAVV